MQRPGLTELDRQGKASYRAGRFAGKLHRLLGPWLYTCTEQKSTVTYSCT
jgi:hypothetical protein